MRFEQRWDILSHSVGTSIGEWSARSIETEQMLFNADWRFLVLCGDKSAMAREFVATLVGLGVIERHGNWSLDTRSHMLMRGHYPAIPGWHHDDVDRGSNGQPDYDRTPNNDGRVMFAVCVDAFNAPTGSMTEFFERGSIVSVPWPVPEDAPVYRYWDAHIEQECTARRETLESGKIVRFTQGDFHRAMPARMNGWRWFARLTVNPGPRPSGPKLRSFSTVYVPVTNAGW